MITRQLIRRFFRFSRATCTVSPDSLHTLRIDIAITFVGGLALVFVALFARIRYLDHFVWNTGSSLPSPYEFLFVALLSTLVAVCLAGWLRMFVIWRELRGGMLQRLENMPIRLAFSRLKGLGWMTMLRQGGLEQQWRDISRSIESMTHLAHQSDLRSDERQQLQSECGKIMADIAHFREQIASPSLLLPKPDYELLENLEVKLAEFGRFLLSSILIPHWRNERAGLVESRETECAPPPESKLPASILAAEEFLAIRYVSLITAVLANLRYLMTFVSVSFVLAFLAWNSSAFQPRQLVDWSFTILLAILGAGVIAVFAQMHRNTLLSRITDTKANELGWDFYFRIVSFGALPVITWLAYQFPDFGNAIYRFIEPAVPIIK